MSTGALLTDEVWSQLDRRSTRLGRRGRWAVVAVAVGAALVLAVTIVARVSGELHPRLSADSTTSERTGHLVSESFQVHNSGWTAETIVGVGAPSAGTALTSVNPRRLTIPAGQSRTLNVHVTIVDCSAFGASRDERLTLHVDRWWGHASATISLPVAGPQSAC